MADREPAVSADAFRAVIDVVVFSKDRSFQLSETLRSLHANVIVPTLDCSDGGVQFRVTVLFKATSPRLQESYNAIEEHWRPKLFVSFVEETDFEAQLWDAVVRPTAKLEAATPRFVMFTVDDAYFVRPWDAAGALRILHEDPHVYAYHVKLHPAITYSHPADKILSLPALRRTSHESDDGSFVFTRAEGTYDWNYPWDLAGFVSFLCC